MPRIYTSANDPLDFCKKHFPPEDVAEQKYGIVNRTGEGPDGRGNCFAYDADHPDYDGEGYHCTHRACRKRLTSVDN